MSARVPEGMSSVNAFAALYENVAGVGQTPGSPWNAIQIFHRYCDKGYCQQVRGVHVGVDFMKAPMLDVKAYDEVYGEGAAQKAIDVYQQKKNKLDSLDQYHLLVNPCKYFTAYWKFRTPLLERRDLDQYFEQCERVTDLEASKLKVSLR
jgi:hypothetical protein